MRHTFLSGDPALDFTATLRSRPTVPFDMLSSPESLDVWFRESGVVDCDTGCGPADLERALVVREAIYLLVVARMSGRPYDCAALALVNSAARTPSAIPQLTPTGRRTEATPAAALSSVARHTVELLSGAEIPLLKACANPECTRIYIDRSRGTRREWCGMDPCGNKMKAAAYRARKRADQSRTDRA